MSVTSVGAVIVLGARENRVHGEGPPELDVSGRASRLDSKAALGYLSNRAAEAAGMTNAGAMPRAEGQALPSRVR
jgi:hypothetical protein